jgi:hypothetical protein
MTMPVFETPLEVLTPFGAAVCTERVDTGTGPSFWVCWVKETGIIFWFLNQELRSTLDWSDGRYDVLPFKLEAKRIEALDGLGRHHTYWRNNIKPGRNAA